MRRFHARLIARVSLNKQSCFLEIRQARTCTCLVSIVAA
jgi:hypothetical protein